MEAEGNRVKNEVEEEGVGDIVLSHELINSNLTWNELLKKYKTETLFPQVFPLLLPYLSPMDIVDLRKVTRAFKITVDFVIQYGPLVREQEQQLVPLLRIPSTLPVYNFTTICFRLCEEIQCFLGEFSEESNPFPGRAITFDPADNVGIESLRMFEILTKEVLRRYGKYVFRLQYKLPKFSDMEYGINNISYILHKVKNIRSLTLTNGCHWLWPTKREKELVRQGGAQCPPLKHLREINLPKQNMFNLEVLQLVERRYQDQVHLTKVP